MELQKLGKHCKVLAEFFMHPDTRAQQRGLSDIYLKMIAR